MAGYEWWPDMPLKKLPENCHIAFVRGHAIEPEQKQTLQQMTNPIGTVIGGLGAVQRLHFILIVLEGSKEDFLNRLIPKIADKRTSQEELWYEELEQQAGEIQYRTLKSPKDAMVEAIKLQERHARGRNEVRKRKIEIKEAANTIDHTEVLMHPLKSIPELTETKSLTQAREEGEKAQRDSEYQPDQDGIALQHVQEEIEEEQDKNPNA